MLNKIKILKVLNAKIIDINDDIYFGDSYSDYISNSKLSLINPDEGGSPQKFKEGLANNKINSSALEFGSAIHEVTLQRDLFYINSKVDKPTGKPGLIIEYLIKNNLELSPDNIIKGSEIFDYYKGCPSEEKILEIIEKNQKYYDYMFSEEYGEDSEAMYPIFLSSYDRYRAFECIKSLTNNQDIQSLLYPEGIFNKPTILNEATIILDLLLSVPFNGVDKEIVLKFKGKLDNFTIDYEDQTIKLNDLKTTGKDVNLFNNSFKLYHYGRQLGLYLWMLKNAIKDEEINFNLSSNILIVQTTPPFTSKVYPIGLESIQKGLEEANKLIKMVAFYEVYGYDKNLKDYE